MKDDEVGGSCNAFGRNETCIYFVRKAWKVETLWMN